MIFTDNVLARKLASFGPLGDEDMRLLDQVVERRRMISPGGKIIGEDDRPTDVHLVLRGIAYRYKTLSDGKRQIVGFMVPGDLCDLHVFMLRRIDHCLSAMSDCTIVDIPVRRIEELTARPAIQRALWWTTLVDEAVLREWLVNMGARVPEQRIAHFFCEMVLRLRSVGMADLHGCELPITQADLADTVGLSTVHINRSLQALREKGLIDLRRTKLAIPDFDRLAAFSGFDGRYLHLAERERKVATTEVR